MADDQNSFLNVPNRLRVQTEQYYSILRQALYDLRVAIPCVVQSFDPVKQTVKVQPAIRERINQNLVPTDVDLPQLIDVPVLFPRAGSYALTFPIQVGDECLVVFTDMCFDAWYQNGKTANVQADKRRHDLSDGIAIFGIWSQPRVLVNYNTTKVQLRNEAGTTYLELDTDAVNIVAGNGGNVNVTVAGNATFDVTGDVDIDAGGNAEIDAAGTVKIQGKDFLLHKHSGVSTGGGQTGGVV